MPSVGEWWAPLRSPDPLWARPGRHRPPLTWASRALHMSCSLSGVMSTGTSNGDPSRCPPSSWNCTSSRCTSRAAASSCANKRNRRQPLGWGGRVPASASLPHPGPAAPHSGREAPPAFTHTHRHRRRHPASPRGRGRLGDRAPQPWAGAAPAGDTALCCCGGKVSRRARPPASGTDSPSTHLPLDSSLPPRPSLPEPCEMQTAFCLFSTGMLAPLYRWGNRGSERLIFPEITETAGD